jgi:hypothetical protein
MGEEGGAAHAPNNTSEQAARRGIFMIYLSESKYSIQCQASCKTFDKLRVVGFGLGKASVSRVGVEAASWGPSDSLLFEPSSVTGHHLGPDIPAPVVPVHAQEAPVVQAEHVNLADGAGAIERSSNPA